ncbi:MAG TPA: hypothetical protein VMU55_02450 [Solirubrobacteraceae bacterium]|nr:hypothetical protein [Solirubrobacteraceae bacterium]
MNMTTIIIAAGIGLGLLIGAFGAGYVHGIEHEQPQILACQKDLTQAQSNESGLKDSIAAQNGAVDAAKALADQAAKDAIAARQLAAAAVAKARTEAQRLRRSQGAPGASVSICPAGAALKIVRGGLK